MTLKEFRKYRTEAEAKATLDERKHARKVAKAFIKDNEELFEMLENL
jgi:hypothetical protein